MEVNGKIIFEETQYFRVKWVWFIILLSVFSSFGITIGTAFLEEGRMGEAVWALAIIVPLEGVMIYLFYIARLQTTVTTEGVYYRLWPFQRKGRLMGKTEIAEAQIKEGPRSKYGYHRLPDYGRVYNTGPGDGIQFVLRNGKKVFLGSKMSAVFFNALSKITQVSRKV